MKFSQGREFDVFHITLGTAQLDQFALVEPDDRHGEGVVVRVTYAVDGRVIHGPHGILGRVSFEKSR